jgi:hypothetical protein
LFSTTWDIQQSTNPWYAGKTARCESHSDRLASPPSPKTLAEEEKRHEYRHINLLCPILCKQWYLPHTISPSRILFALYSHPSVRETLNHKRHRYAEPNLQLTPLITSLCLTLIIQSCITSPSYPSYQKRSSSTLCLSSARRIGGCLHCTSC